MAKNWTKTKIKVPTELSASERRAFAEDVIEYISDRTRKGKGKDNKPWKTAAARKYSDAYKETLEYKSKTSKGKVNLELFGDMLDSIDIISNRPGEIEIGIKRGDSDYGKAEGNIRGTYGNKKPIRGKARNFMELSRSEKNKLRDEFLDESEIGILEKTLASKAAQLLAEKVLSESE